MKQIIIIDYSHKQLSDNEIYLCPNMEIHLFYHEVQDISNIKHDNMITYKNHSNYITNIEIILFNLMSIIQRYEQYEDILYYYGSKYDLRVLRDMLKAIYPGITLHHINTLAQLK